MDCPLLKVGFLSAPDERQSTGNHSRLQKRESHDRVNLIRCGEAEGVRRMRLSEFSPVLEGLHKMRQELERELMAKRTQPFTCTD
ncbi:Hypothetical protein DEACI_0003 [Acididesulfobacillus acetoxydans]|uniref:Uncharacterized protein n=1 Tax=Acididesulfobacillus acetoxydans TaxID=1561005 RepID=A0A8S0WV33_9FIRM|nr:Hypothetical protein DEACI_0003 [Acididesulfobacillus acetoxydans]CEJ06813.1 Hypothetical protein DEACI_1264 [Acididesulfobacillus acetoxydans]